MFLHKTPTTLARLVYPQMLWKINNPERAVYLTFDDGPVPEATPLVLDILRNYAAKATFFCVGENISKHKQLFQQVWEEQHAIGNHTYNHLNGWKNNTKTYLQNVSLADEAIVNAGYKTAKRPFFRPPYGKISRKQVKLLAQKYQIVMWDVLTGDFSGDISKEKCLKKTIMHTRPGSIVVFHDSIKTIEKLEWVLPRYLEYLKSRDMQSLALS